MSVVKHELFFEEKNTDVRFLLKNQNELIIEASIRNDPNSIYKTIYNNQTLVQFLKKKVTNTKGFYEKLKAIKKQNFSMIVGQNTIDLSVFLDQNTKIAYKIQLTYIKKELINLQEQQQQLDDIIQQLQDQINTLKVTENKKNQEILALSTQKINAQSKLSQINEKYQNTRKKFVSNQIDFDQKYGTYVDQKNGKHRLFMKQKNVTDQMIQQIVTLDLRKIQVLSLGDNKITDIGFNLLFNQEAGKKWPVLIELFLQNNKIENIHSLAKITNLETMAIYQNQLSLQSCNYLCQNMFVNLTTLRVSFKKSTNNDCWKKLLEKLDGNFPKLKELWYSNEGDIGAVMKKKILDFCNEKNIALNHSVGINGDESPEILKLKLLAKLLGAKIETQ